VNAFEIRLGKREEFGNAIHEMVEDGAISHSADGYR
jgi:hypothetical protein